MSWEALALEAANNYVRAGKQQHAGVAFQGLQACLMLVPFTRRSKALNSIMNPG